LELTCWRCERLAACIPMIWEPKTATKPISLYEIL
jgi:hypothetical protein